MKQKTKKIKEKIDKYFLQEMKKMKNNLEYIFDRHDNEN